MEIVEVCPEVMEAAEFSSEKAEHEWEKIDLVEQRVDEEERM